MLGLGLALFTRAVQRLGIGGGGGGGVPAGGDGTMDFSDADASGLVALLEDI